MGEFFRKLFDTSDYPARWHCGNWASFEGWLHILSDLGIWIAYMGIPIGLAIVVRRRRGDVPFAKVFWLFCAFIATCGIGHLIEAGIFWWPAYRLSGLVKFITAIVSIVTMVVMIRLVSKALAMPGMAALVEELNTLKSSSKAEIEQLTMDRERLRFSVEAARVGQWDWEIEPDRVTWDKTTHALFGLGMGQRPANIQSFLQIVAPSDRERVAEEFERAAYGADSMAFTFRMLRPDGTTRVFLARGSVLRDAARGNARLSGVVLDVTEQQLAQELFQDVFESAPCGMLLVTEDGKIVLANGSAANLFGWQVDELVGRPVEDLVPETVAVRHANLRGEYWQSPTHREMAAGRELSGLRKDGTHVPVEIGLSPVRLSQDRAVISTIVDISRHKEAEEKARRYAAELELRNQSLDEVAYMISHDLRAPLRAINLTSEILTTDYADKLDGEAHEMLALLRDRATKMDDLIRGALDYARAGRMEGTATRVHVGAAIKEVLTMLPEGTASQVSIVSDLPEVVCNDNHLVKILLNLVSNAAQHNDDSAPRIEIGAERRGEHEAIWVQDNGPGIAAQHHERIFKMFQRLPSARGETTGVGLSIVRTLAERNGGGVELDSATGSGARFTVLLPASAPAGEPAAETASGAAT